MKKLILIISLGISLTVNLDSLFSESSQIFSHKVYIEYKNGKNLFVDALIISPNGHLLINEFNILNYSKIFVIDSEGRNEINLVASDAYTQIAILKEGNKSKNFHNISSLTTNDFPDNYYASIPEIGFVVSKLKSIDCNKFNKMDNFFSSFPEDTEIIKCTESNGEILDLNGKIYNIDSKEISYIPYLVGGIIRNKDNNPIGLIQSAIISGSSIRIKYISFTKISKVTTKIIKDGYFKRPSLHIYLTNKNESPSIVMISENSPAKKAGLLIGDQLKFINDYQIKKSEDLVKILENFEIGDIITLSISRNGENIIFKVVLD